MFRSFSESVERSLMHTRRRITAHGSHTLTRSICIGNRNERKKKNIYHVSFCKCKKRTLRHSYRCRSNKLFVMNWDRQNNLNFNLFIFFSLVRSKRIINQLNQANGRSLATWKEVSCFDIHLENKWINLIWKVILGPVSITLALNTRFSSETECALNVLERFLSGKRFK